jgi:hypothetical protein
LYYPQEVSKNTELYQYNNELKQLLVLEFGKLAGDEDVTEEAIDKREREMLRLTIPNIWNVYQKGNLEIEMETGFDKFLVALGEHTTEKLDEITVFRFYSLLGFLKEKNKPKK